MLIVKKVMGLIHNPLNVEITKKEIYNDIFEFRIPSEFYFESCGTSYGNCIYGHLNLDNYYIIKKRENDGAVHKEL